MDILLGVGNSCIKPKSQFHLDRVIHCYDNSKMVNCGENTFIAVLFLSTHRDLLDYLKSFLECLFRICLFCSGLTRSPLDFRHNKDHCKSSRCYFHSVLLNCFRSVLLTSFHPVLLNYFHPVLLTSFHSVHLTSFHSVFLAYFHSILLTSFHLVLLNYFH